MRTFEDTPHTVRRAIGRGGKTGENARAKESRKGIGMLGGRSDKKTAKGRK